MKQSTCQQRIFFSQEGVVSLYSVPPHLANPRDRTARRLRPIGRVGSLGERFGDREAMLHKALCIA